MLSRAIVRKEAFSRARIGARDKRIAAVVVTTTIVLELSTGQMFKDFKLVPRNHPVALVSKQRSGKAIKTSRSPALKAWGSAQLFTKSNIAGTLRPNNVSPLMLGWVVGKPSLELRSQGGFSNRNQLVARAVLAGLAIEASGVLSPQSLHESDDFLVGLQHLAGRTGRRTAMQLNSLAP